VLNEKRAKQFEAVDDELAKLKTIHADGTIDQFTYYRLRKLLMRARIFLLWRATNSEATCLLREKTSEHSPSALQREHVFVV
jgi:hypothetical protein